MKTLLILLLSVCSVLADNAVSIHSGSTGSGKEVARGCVSVAFDLVGFTGTIGNASFSNITLALPAIQANQDGKTLSAIPYTVTSGTLIITEVR